MTLWSVVDEPVLSFLAAQPSSMPPGWSWQLELRPTIPSTEIDGLDERQIDESLLRLQTAGLIDSLERVETIGYAYWSRLRVTALGSMVMGVWPDFERVDAVDALQLNLAALESVEEDPEARKGIRRAAGVLGSLGASVVSRIVESESGDLGGEVG